jgi:hypothetical protein
VEGDPAPEVEWYKVFTILVIEVTTNVAEPELEPEAHEFASFS